MRKILLAAVLLVLGIGELFSQSSISGSLDLNANFYKRDSARGACCNPFYDDLLSGGESWFSLNYNNFDWDFNAGLRLDFFQNSNLHDPVSPFTGIGIGRVWVTKGIGKAQVTVGHFYDQFGRGITFRAYEERSLAIDNAILGVKMKYQLTDNWFVKGFMGQQKDIFTTYDPIIKGINIEGYETIGDHLSLAPGVSYLNRTLDQASMDLIVSIINTYPKESQFVPKYNVHTISGYNTLNWKNFEWYIEGAYKTEEAIRSLGGDTLINKDGSVFYTSLGYSVKGFGIIGQYKRTDHFDLRTSPLEGDNDGLITFLPPLARQNNYRLTTFYNPQTQLIGEEGVQMDVVAALGKHLNLQVNASYINDLAGKKLYREVYTELKYKPSRKWYVMVGGQVLDYNQQTYEGKGDTTMMVIVPLTEILVKFDRKTSLRTEMQYMSNQKDFGSWFFVLGEVNIAPRWAFSISDMINTSPKKIIDPRETEPQVLHYLSIFASYNVGGNRFSVAYIQQREGIVCVGGVCRFEPAFSGFRLSLNSNF